MKVMQIVLTVIDFDQVGPDGIKELIENARYPNRCISPLVRSVDVREIGEWSDEHPLNNSDSAEEELSRLFCEENAILLPALAGVTKDMLDGGWTAKGLSDHAKLLEKVEAKYLALLEAVSLAYGHLWHVQNEPMAPKPIYSAEKAAMEARKILRNMISHEQRGAGINAIQNIIGATNGN